MYEVFITWYQEFSDNIQEKIMFRSDDFEDSWQFLKTNVEKYVENYPVEEIGIRLSKKNKNNLKTELMSAMEEFVGVPNTMDLRYRIHYKVNEILQWHGLSDFEWKLENKEDSILEIVPLREIDKYVLKGIMSE